MTLAGVVVACMAMLSAVAPAADACCPSGGGSGSANIAITRAVDPAYTGPGAPAAPGYVADDLNQIDCGADCVGTYPWGCDSVAVCDFTTVTLTASTVNGWGFTKWGGSCSGTANPCTLDSAKTNQTVTAYFTDVGAPTVSLNSPPAANTHVRTVSLNASGQDNAAVASYQFFVKASSGGAEVANGSASSSSSHAFDLTGLADGTYQFGVRARDYAGNISNAATVSLVLDRTVAAPVLGGSPANGAWITTTTPTITWGTLDPDASASCSVGGGAFAACASGWQPTLAQGTNTITVRATDGAGNTADAIRTIKVDSVAPTGSLTGADVTNAPSLAVAANGTGSAPTTTCAVDSGPFAPCSGTYSPGGLADGPHTAHLHVADEAGNAIDVSKPFTVDTVAPAASIGSGPPDGAMVAANAVAFAFNAESGAALSCSLDSESDFRACSGTAQDVLSGIADGLHQWRLRAVDAAGNVTVLARAFTVDTTPPTVAVTGGPPEGSTLEATSATFGFSPEAGTTVACSLDSDAQFHNCSTGTTDAVSGLTPGVHVWRVRVADAAGNATVASRTFTVTTPSKGAGPGKITTGMRYKWTVRGAKTYIVVLKTHRLPAGAAVTVTCKGGKAKGCPFKRKAFKAAKGIVDLHKAFRRPLNAGAVVTVAITRKGSAGRAFTFTTRKGNTPKTRTRALPIS